MRRFALLGLITLIFLLGFELAARAAMWRARDPWAEFAQQGQQIPAADLSYEPLGLGDLRPYQRGVFSPNFRPYQVITNNAGLRNIAPLAAPDEAVRILVLGDSFTFGVYLDNADTWPFWLENALNNAGDQSYQVLNAAIPSYSIQHQLAYMQEKGRFLEPDLVILGFYINDIWDLTPQKRAEFARPGGAPPIPILQVAPDEAERSSRLALLRERSGLFDAARWLRFKLQVEEVEQAINFEREGGGLTQEGISLATAITYSGADHPDYGQYWGEYAALFGELVALAAEQNLRLVVVAIPALEQVPTGAYPDTPQAFMRDLTSQHNIPYLDLLPILRADNSPLEALYLVHYDASISLDDTDPYWSSNSRYIGDRHMSRYGYWHLGGSIGVWLMDMGMVD